MRSRIWHTHLQKAGHALAFAADKFRCRSHIIAALVALALARPEDSTDLWGFVVVFLGILLRGWAMGCLRKNAELCVEGPYAYVRNPLYLGSAVALLGYCVMLNNPWATGVVLALGCCLFVATIRVEERSLRELFGADYEAYCRAVPRLVPRLRPYRYGARNCGFSWRQATRNRVLLRSLAPLVIALAFEAKEELLERLPEYGHSLAGLVR